MLRDVNLRANPNVAQQIGELGRDVQAANVGLNQQDLAARARLLDREQSVADANFNCLFDMESFLYGTGLRKELLHQPRQADSKGFEEKLLIDTIPGRTASYANLQDIPSGDPAKTAQELIDNNTGRWGYSKS